MKLFLRRYWFVVLACLYLAWHLIPHAQKTPEAVVQSAPQIEASVEPTIPARKTLPFKRKPIRRSWPARVATLVATAVPTELPTLVPTAMPTAEPELIPQPTAQRSPQARSDQGVLEGVAFKDEEEVLANLGEPDETLEHDDRESWYYSKPAHNRYGKPVCPELQFIDDEVRMVLMWPPEKMKEKIATAKRLKSDGASSKGPQTFTFMDSFKYLGVGTPEATVLEDLGAPDSKQALDGKEEWNYDTLIVENGSSRRLTVVMLKGKVLEVRGR